MVPELDGFPRVRRYTLGAQLETRLLSVLERLVEAAYTREKRAALARANLERLGKAIQPLTTMGLTAVTRQLAY